MESLNSHTGAYTTEFGAAIRDRRSEQAPSEMSARTEVGTSRSGTHLEEAFHHIVSRLDETLDEHIWNISAQKMQNTMGAFSLPFFSSPEKGVD